MNRLAAGLALTGLLALGPATAAVAAAPAPAPASAPAPAAAATSATTAPAASPPGGTATPGGVPLPAGPGTSSAGAGTTDNQPLSGRAKAAAVLGGLLLIGLLWAFSQGFGLLGGRGRPPAAAGRTAPQAGPPPA